MLTLQPESSQWDLRPEILTLPIGVLNSATDLFDTFEVEAGEGLAPDVERVLLATSTRSDGLLITPAALRNGSRRQARDPWARNSRVCDSFRHYAR